MLPVENLRGEPFNENCEPKKMVEIESENSELQPCTSASLVENKNTVDEKIEGKKDCVEENRKILLDFENLRQADDDNYDYHELEVLLSENVNDLNVKKRKVETGQIPVSACSSVVSNAIDLFVSTAGVNSSSMISNEPNVMVPVSNDISQIGNNNVLNNTPDQNNIVLPNTGVSNDDRNVSNPTQIPPQSVNNCVGRNNFDFPQPSIMTNVPPTNHGFQSFNSFPNQFGYNSRQMPMTNYWGGNSVSPRFFNENNMAFMSMSHGNGCYMPGVSQPMNMGSNFTPFGTMPSNFVGTTNNLPFYGSPMAGTVDNRGMTTYMAPNTTPSNDNMFYNQF